VDIVQKKINLDVKGVKAAERYWARPILDALSDSDAEVHPVELDLVQRGREYPKQVADWLRPAQMYPWNNLENV